MQVLFVQFFVALGIFYHEEGSRLMCTASFSSCNVLFVFLVLVLWGLLVLFLAYVMVRCVYGPCYVVHVFILGNLCDVSAGCFEDAWSLLRVSGFVGCAWCSGSCFGRSS